MGEWAVGGHGRIETAGANGTSSGATVVTAAGSANTKGSYAQLIAATASTASALIVSVRTVATTDSGLLDIAVGGAGSEQIIIPNILLASELHMMSAVTWPISIPAGSRIAARLQNTTASATYRVAVYLLSGAFGMSAPGHTVSTYGAATADSGGTQVDPGISAHTKGAWAQITASTDRDHRGLILGVGNQENTAATAGTWLVDVGVGGSGSEQVIIPNWRIHASVDENLAPPQSPCLPVSIPAGSRLAVRAQSSITNATDRLFDAVLYGVS